jgi:hypothetical protein
MVLTERTSFVVFLAILLGLLPLIMFFAPLLAG